MWINRQEKNPEYNGAYSVYGLINKGTEYEKNCIFTAYWDNGIKSFTDKDGEDLIYINEGVKFWFDFGDIPNPI